MTAHDHDQRRALKRQKPKERVCAELIFCLYVCVWMPINFHTFMHSNIHTKSHQWEYEYSCGYAIMSFSQTLAVESVSHTRGCRRVTKCKIYL